MSEPTGPPVPTLGSSEREESGMNLPPVGPGGVMGGLPPVPPRKKASPAKKAVLLSVWIILLGTLFFFVMHFGASTDAPTNPNLPPPDAPVYHPNPAKMAAAWPDIVKHAAAPPRGASDAPYTLAEFGDFQCPQCGKAYPVVEKILAQNAGKVNLIFVHRPFPTDSAGNVMHQWAIPAAVCADAAGKQGRFWAMYDYLYTHQEDLEPGFYPKYAKTLGLNMAQFNADSASPAAKARVQETQAFTQNLGILETPTFLLRDNRTGNITVFVGTAGTKTFDGKADLPGMDDLLARPPWKK